MPQKPLSEARMKEYSSARWRALHEKCIEEFELLLELGPGQVVGREAGTHSLVKLVVFEWVEGGKGDCSHIPYLVKRSVAHETQIAL